ncbi:MAG: cyclase [Chloroflexi bacterium HGW-Chloroflexi-9]|nr:MAG: cyclase [Chloroflexi bacterium HGW-Chloroflexi-9]
MMHTVTHKIVVNVPIETVYDQWTRFEEFPRFMDAVTKVTHLDDRRLLWNAHVLGRDITWEAAIDRLAPDSAIEWHSTDGPQHRGAVRFEPCAGDGTSVFVELEYTPRGLAERVAATARLVNLRVQGDLKRFKEFVELESQEAPAWHPAPLTPARAAASAIPVEVREREVSPVPARSAKPAAPAHGRAIRI